MQQGVIKSIELGLDLKFRNEGARLLPESMKIDNVALLNMRRSGIKGTQCTDKMRQIGRN